MRSPKDGKRYTTDVANIEQLLRIIQSIPSKKAEPFKFTLRTEFDGLKFAENFTKDIA